MLKINVFLFSAICLSFLHFGHTYLITIDAKGQECLFERVDAGVKLSK